MAVAPAPRRTGWLTHEKYYWHDSGVEAHGRFVQPKPSNEGPEGKRRFANLVAVSELADKLVPVKPRLATEEEILRVHTARHVARLKEISSAPGGGLVGHELHIGHGGWEIIQLSCGGVLAAVEEVLAGRLDNAYCLVRPPGHHAEPDEGHGFCAVNNVAVAAEAALASGLERVAIVDFDVHHGNGTETAFLGRRDVLFISLHQDRLYPLDRGDVDAVGEGEGRGYNLNIPLPPGSGEGAYAAAFERVVLPALRAYKPQLILVSSGFDASFLDPLGRMMLTSASFGRLSRMLVDASAELAAGLVFAHEGGYSELYVPFCGVAVLEALSGAPGGTGDPFIEDVGSPAWQALQPHQDAAVARAEANLHIALLPAIAVRSDKAGAAAGGGIAPPS